eukprot:m.170552 g.170552  ORF g.170552 m.170552 type:complete len:279 (-) comp14534_c0_seq10:326-1162(-)
MLQRRVALNNLADAGLKMLQSPAQVSQMRLDLERVDLDAIKRESTWVTDCPPEFVDQVFVELRQFLEKPRGLSYASHWLYSIVSRTFTSSLRGLDSDLSSGASNPDSGSSSMGQPKATSSAHGEEVAAKLPSLDSPVKASGKHQTRSAGASADAAARPLDHTSDGAGQDQSAVSDKDESTSTSSRALAHKLRKEQHAEIIHKTAKKLLQAWTFYSSQILRELTVKSAPSFGSCNALKLLLDEYMYYLVQTRVTHPHKQIVHPDMIVLTQEDESGGEAE